MAFVSRVGNILKQTISNHVKLELLESKPSVYQATRCMSLMSSSKVFVGGFPYSTDEMSLRETFAQYGEVVEARIVTDRETGRSRGFGFVCYTSSDEASSAIQALDGKVADYLLRIFGYPHTVYVGSLGFSGPKLRVNYAAEKSRAGFGSGGYGNSGSSHGASGDYGSGGTSYGNSLGGRSSGSISSFGGEDGGQYDGATRTTFGNQGGRIGNEDFAQDVIEENNKVDNHEVHEVDYANTRG